MNSNRAPRSPGFPGWLARSQGTDHANGIQSGSRIWVETISPMGRSRATVPNRNGHGMWICAEQSQPDSRSNTQRCHRTL